MINQYYWLIQIQLGRQTMQNRINGWALSLVLNKMHQIEGTTLYTERFYYACPKIFYFQHTSLFYSRNMSMTFTKICYKKSRPNDLSPDCVCENNNRNKDFLKYRKSQNLGIWFTTNEILWPYTHFTQPNFNSAHLHCAIT